MAMDMVTVMEVIMSSETKESRNEELIDISTIVDDLWKGLVKFWWLFFVLASICASLFYFKERRAYSPVYTAYATYIVTSEDMYNYSDSYNQKAAEQIGTIFPYILSSDVLQQLVAEDMGMEQVPGSISSEVMEGTNLISVKAKAGSPQTAYDLLMAVIDNYPTVAAPVIGEVNMSLMDESGVPIGPDNPYNFKRTALKGAMVGIILTLILVLIYALTRNTIKKKEELKKFLNISCLGVLPRARFKKRGKVKKPRVMIDNEMIPWAFLEANRTTRTRLERTLKDKNIGSFLVTSAIAGEGKTTVACNLALGLVKRGHSVLLVDGDLRKPAVAPTLGIENGEYSFYDVLTGCATFREAEVNYLDTGLRVITGGRPIMNTQRLLNAKSVKDIMKELKTEAEYVIVDTPPSAILSDAAVISQYVDGALFVVRQDYAKVDEILEGIESLSDTGIPIMGCVLNAAEVGITGYGYGNDYGYGRYGYGYGRYGRYGSYGRYGYGSTGKKAKSAKGQETEEAEE